eukprot:TRINITY_DN35274_c0_g2_i1.p1 TRINITY_DN35274_c0_g2~~TRINITY_DN35274_c0_g2_i1.p1  ORF type:complete len:274 (+),score=33.85 TRINITY_DN35274_c0_g2_i1:38-859(+)
MPSPFDTQEYAPQPLQAIGWDTLIVPVTVRKDVKEVTNTVLPGTLRWQAATMQETACCTLITPLLAPISSQSQEWQTLLPAETQGQTLLPQLAALPAPGRCEVPLTPFPLLEAQSATGRRQVWLHVYDMSLPACSFCRLNDILRLFQTGAFHVAVEVDGQEWSFVERARGSGVYSCQPRSARPHVYRESVAMGCTCLSEEEVSDLITGLQEEWQGASYDVFLCNCCHFSDTFCRWLGVGPLPGWVSHLPQLGATLVLAGTHAVEGCRNLQILI